MTRWHDGTMKRWHDGNMERWHEIMMVRHQDDTMKFLLAQYTIFVKQWRLFLILCKGRASLVQKFWCLIWSKSVDGFWKRKFIVPLYRPNKWHCSATHKWFVIYELPLNVNENGNKEDVLSKIKFIIYLRSHLNARKSSF